MGVDCEPVVICGGSDELFEDGWVGLGHRPADLTNKVTVRRSPEVKGRRPLASMAVFDHADALELFQDPVDGRGGDVGTLGLYVSSELVSSPMCGVGRHDLEQESLGGRCATARSAHGGET